MASRPPLFIVLPPPWLLLLVILEDLLYILTSQWCRALELRVCPHCPVPHLHHRDEWHLHHRVSQIFVSFCILCLQLQTHMFTCGPLCISCGHIKFSMPLQLSGLPAFLPPFYHGPHPGPIPLQSHGPSPSHLNPSWVFSLKALSS